MDDNEIHADSNDDTFELGIAYSCTTSDEAFQLFRTTLPIISITYEHELIDDEKIPGNIRIIESGIVTIKDEMGIKIRGASSRTHPK